MNTKVFLAKSEQFWLFHKKYLDCVIKSAQTTPTQFSWNRLPQCRTQYLPPDIPRNIFFLNLTFECCSLCICNVTVKNLRSETEVSGALTLLCDVFSFLFPFLSFVGHSLFLHLKSQWAVRKYFPMPKVQFPSTHDSKYMFCLCNTVETNQFVMI